MKRGEPLVHELGAEKAEDLTPEIKDGGEKDSHGREKPPQALPAQLKHTSVVLLFQQDRESARVKAVRGGSKNRSVRHSAALLRPAL